MLAGNGIASFSGDGGPAASAGRFGFFPQHAAVFRAEVAARAQLAAQRQPESDNLTASVK